MKTAVNILVLISMLGVAIAFFFVIWRTGMKLFGLKDEVFKKLNEYDYNKGLLTGKKRELSKLGIMYRVKNYDLAPSYYLILRICIGLLTAVLLFLLTSKIILIPIGLVAGFFLTHAYFVYENKKDNEEMIIDIYNTYANLKIQMTAGIYIREVLEYTYASVNNERYKDALGELILNFSDKTVQSSDAVIIFKDRFDSQEINKLSALILSFMQFGLNSNHADDIMAEIQSLIQAATLKTEHDIEMKAGIINFGFFTIIILMVVYIVFCSFSSTSLF